MRIVVDPGTDAVLRKAGAGLALVDGQQLMLSHDQAVREARLNGAVGDPSQWLTLAITNPAQVAALAAVPEAALVPVWEDGALVGVEIAPDWQAPEPQPDALTVRLEALEAAVAVQAQAVAANILASPHDRRWLAQKERAKLFGVAWLKANPEATMEDLGTAVAADLAQQFPGEPVVVSAGIIMSYATEAAARGYIPDGSFETLRALVVAASADQLQAMLAAL